MGTEQRLERVGSDVDCGEVYPVWVDLEGWYWTWDPAVRGAVCQCTLGDRWSLPDLPEVLS